MNDPAKHAKLPGVPLKTAQLHAFFTNHLNRIYCAKAHLVERLPELAEQADFQDLKHAILETREDINRQIARMQEIYILLEEVPSIANCEDMISLVEDGFSAIFQQKDEAALRDLAILFYLSLIESMEIASFKLLQMVANKLPDKQITQLLKENFDDSRADRLLFSQITAKYIV